MEQDPLTAAQPQSATANDETALEVKADEMSSMQEWTRRVQRVREDGEFDAFRHVAQTTNVTRIAQLSAG